jgi:hypothetical protein
MRLLVHWRRQDINKGHITLNDSGENEGVEANRRIKESWTLVRITSAIFLSSAIECIGMIIASVAPTSNRISELRSSQTPYSLAG